MQEEMGALRDKVIIEITKKNLVRRTVDILEESVRKDQLTHERREVVGE